MSVHAKGLQQQHQSQEARDVEVMRLAQVYLLHKWLAVVFCDHGVVIVDDRYSEMQTGSLRSRPENNNTLLWELIGKCRKDKVYGDAVFVPNELVRVELYEKYMSSKQKRSYSTQTQCDMHPVKRQHRV